MLISANNAAKIGCKISTEYTVRRHYALLFMKRIITIAIVWIALHCTAEANSVVYTLSGTGTGSLGATPFSDVVFTITSTADTANITESQLQPGPPGYYIFVVPDITATVFVSGLGAATFTIPTHNFDNFNTDIAGISASDLKGDILDINNSAFTSYDLSSSLGPLTGTPLINPGVTFQTTVGDFSLSSISFVTFQADVVPEPSTFAFLGVALFGLVLWRQRHKTMPFSFTIEVRQIMFQFSSSLQRERHFCSDANPYAIGRRGLRRNRNVWVAASSDLSHFELESTPTADSRG
jgi:hypothetical protein